MGKNDGIVYKAQGAVVLDVEDDYSIFVLFQSFILLEPFNTNSILNFMLAEYVFINKCYFVMMNKLVYNCIIIIHIITY